MRRPYNWDYPEIEEWEDFAKRDRPIYIGGFGCRPRFGFGYGFGFGGFGCRPRFGFGFGGFDCRPRFGFGGFGCFPRRCFPY